MRLRTAAAAGALAVTAPMGLAQIAQAQPDRDCADFDSQAAAQETFDRQTGDPFNLDADDDGRACEAGGGAGTDTEAGPDTEDGTGAAEDDAAEAPRGSVQAGDGGAAADPGDVAPAVAVAAGLGLAAGGTVLTLRRRASRADAER